MSSWCILKLPVTANNIKILGVTQKCFWGEFMLPANNKTYLVLLENYPTFLSDFR
jgi:hypothetical protein